MNNRIHILRTRLNKEKGKREQIEKSIIETKSQLRDFKRNLYRHERAREIVWEVGLATQQQLQFHISDITTLALEAVFDDPYELLVEFVKRRNNAECDLLFSRDGDKIDPISASGGGAVDVASFALRIAAWSMQTPKTRNTIILDEPLRFLSADKQERASQMIKELSMKLGLQFIIVTHEETLTQFADKVFNVKIRNGISQVKESLAE
ncbi:MAG: hypothetical protein JXA68_00215 [Ignavibacteriales bacterium]|nr:hypothetical protein [Ignavibacteriales bacterium]